MAKKPRLIITIPQGLKRAVEAASRHRSCSQAEILRSALIQHLQVFIDQDNQQGGKDGI